MTSRSQHSNAEFFLMDRRDAAILGEGITTENQPDAFSIVPVVIPVRKATVMALSIGVSLLITILVTVIYNGKPISHFFDILPAFFFATVFIIAVVFVYAYFANKKAHRLGPLLVYEKDTGLVILPRQNQSFMASQIIHLQVLSVPGTGNYLLMKITELNLLTIVDGHRMRWPIIGKISEYKSVEPVLKELLENTQMPVMRYKQYKRRGKLRIEISNMRDDSDQGG